MATGLGKEGLLSEGLYSLEERVKMAAHRLGFVLVGITTPSSPDHLETYQRWIDAGRHAGMGYLATERAMERRVDPNRILPDCKSVIVTTTPYLPGDHRASTEEAETRIASYALGDDYHVVITERLEQLVRSIEEIVRVKFPYRVYTDTGPIMEREFAQRAGLGWIGKNTCVINPEFGSYFLLGEILLGIDLKPDGPFEPDRCGSCVRCIEACPTGCILPDRTIDSNRCISYLTIEEKGAIEPSLRPEIGHWLFGCDICQQVCPWNQRFAIPTGDPAFQPRPTLRDPELADFLALKPGRWLADLRGSAMERPRRRGLVRNAAIAAGNRADQDHIKSLTNLLLNDPEPVVRQHAAWAICQIDARGSEQALRKALEDEHDGEVQHEIQRAITALVESAQGKPKTLRPSGGGQEPA